ncbi:MAG: isoaspartyl peptidase/L-asparaginase [Flavobacteriales bacterium]|nr:isoaspartyl peptidase/L-asparaginase [Flavobacteriales bacterium]
MKQQILVYILISFAFFSCLSPQNNEIEEEKKIGPITIVIHGGAGTILKKNMTLEKEQAYREKLAEALNLGYEVLENGGTSIEAVASSIRILEDSPLFNAGKGAVFTNQGKNELDASIMDGKTSKAGAVAGVTTVKNPIMAALAVMENSPHVMMSGGGAELFAVEQGIEIADSGYFFTKRRYNSLRRIQKKEEEQSAYLTENPDYKYGTVGAVALDSDGNIAAGTSTGGMTNKRYGRIGDSPIIGAGTFAENASCAISATGHGEFFIRNVVAYDIAALMKYKQLSLEDAAQEVINKKLVEQKGSGGIIGLDQAGNITMTFNTAGMYRGYIQQKDNAVIKIFGE